MASPPITIGEITDVPAPSSPVKSAWAQEISNRVVQRYANKAALDAWAAADGSIAFTTDKRVWMRTGGKWVLFAGSMPRISVTRGAVQSLANAAVTPVLWTAETGLPDVENIHDNAVNPSRMTIPAAFPGLWRFEYFVDFSANNIGYRYCWITIDGITSTRYGAIGFHATDNAHGPYLSSTAELVLNAGQYVEVVALQDSGVALNIVGVVGSRFVARYVGPA